MHYRCELRILAVLTLSLGLAAGCQSKTVTQPSSGGKPKPKASRVSDTETPPADRTALAAKTAPPGDEPVNAKDTPEPTPAPADQPAAPTADSPTTGTKSKMTITQAPFGKTADDQDITLFTISNGAGLTVKLINYGATIISVETPDRTGKVANINLGFPTLDGYLQRHPYFGSTVGRFCNRIAGGKFKLDDNEHTLATNNAPNHLHGGKVGFDARVWAAEETLETDSVGVTFKLVSADGDEGYPGTLAATVKYSVNAANELRMEYLATTDKPTIVNLTNHCYWNLSGAGSGTILEHHLQIEADQYLPVNETSIPTGALTNVQETNFDFTTPHAIGERIQELTGEPGGYDHCYALRGQDGKLALAARVSDPASGRVMEILTTEPGIQFYTGNYLSGMPGENNYSQNGALCLETQHYPDAPNQPTFASTRLDPGKTYQSTTVHRFSVVK